MSARRYWARCILTLALGAALGLLLGLVLESTTDTQGWAIFAATGGFLVGLIWFALTT